MSILASYNVTIVTDNGTGDYTVNFTTSFSSTDYNIVFGGIYDSGTFNVPNIKTGTTPTVSAATVVSTDNAGTGTDCSRFSVTCFGDQ